MICSKTEAHNIYRLKSTEEHQEDALRRIARDQVSKSLSEISDRCLDTDDTIHQVRKRCKKVRGLLRLYRPAMGEAYAEANAWFRDTARHAATIRDAAAMIESYDRLCTYYADQIDRPAFAHIRADLTRRYKQVHEQKPGVDKIVDTVRCRLELGRRCIDSWSLNATEYDAIRDGFIKTYRRGRKAMQAVIDDPAADKVHEWRKRAKYHRYHMRLLRTLWRKVINARRDQLHRLTDLLGECHDLAELSDWLKRAGDSCVMSTSYEAFLALAGRRRAELKAEAILLGRRLFHDKPKRLADRVGTWWKVCKTDVRISLSSSGVA